MTVNLSVCAGTDVGAVHPKNQDAFVVADLTKDRVLGGAPSSIEVGERGVLLAVSDGMGGHKAGDVASSIVVQSLLRTMAAEPPAPIADGFVENAVQQANLDVWEASHAPGKENMGATLTALLLRGHAAYFAEVGDSRAYLLRGGQLVQVTRDQSYVQVLVDSGVLKPEEAGEAPHKNWILQAMGQAPKVTVALSRLDLRNGDGFIVCSDGLTNHVNAGEMTETIAHASGIDAACAELIDLAKRHGGTDDITLILAGVRGDLPAPVPQESISDTLRVLQEFDPLPKT